MPWGAIILLAIHLGAEEVLVLFPNLPAWLVAILQALSGAKSAALSLPLGPRTVAVEKARAEALKAVHLHCSGVACPPDLKGQPD